MYILFKDIGKWISKKGKSIVPRIPKDGAVPQKIGGGGNSVKLINQTHGK